MKLGQRQVGRRPGDPRLELLQTPYFAALRPREARQAARHVDRCELPAGTRVQARGYLVHWVWVVVDGCLVLRDGDAIVGSLGPGEVFGEAEALAHQPSPVEVVTGPSSVLLAVPVPLLNGLLAPSPFAVATSGRLARRAVATASR
jgi:CRP-like cAMP-binding protein